MTDAKVTTRADFKAVLRRRLPGALRTLQHGNIAPVDLAQAAIGPGMAIFSGYAKVLEQDGSPMRVRTALELINEALDAIVAEQEGDFDADTRFAVTWYSQHEFAEGKAGEADVLARARNTSVAGLKAAGVLTSSGDKVRLLKRSELDPAWDPVTDRRPTVWEATQHLVRRHFDDGSIDLAAELLTKLGGLGDTARELAYRLHLVATQRRSAEEALAYNSLVTAWPDITARARQVSVSGPAQQTMGLEA